MIKRFGPDNLEFTLEMLWRNLFALFGAVDSDIDQLNSDISNLETTLSITTNNDGGLLIGASTHIGGEE